MDFREEFVKLRKQYIEYKFSALNPRQREAVLSCNGASLILAGAGSGKTTVIVNRIMNLLQFGNAYESNFVCYEPNEQDVALLKACIDGECVPDERLSEMLRAGNVHPWNILAITFTNKAAGEMKERIVRAVGEQGNDVFASTFHSACVRFLRRYSEKLGWPKDFTIYDTSDSERTVKAIYKAFGISDKEYPVKTVLSRFGYIRDNLMTIQEYSSAFSYESTTETVCRVYQEYCKRLREAGAFDFDDLIFYAVKLLEENEDVREYYHNRFRYVMVDEYQDTSHAQFRLVQLLTNSNNNIFVVGDDDQSIYSFRGATIENILNFDKLFAPVRTIKLEQNYRSTSNILNCANNVIANNSNRKGKNLWTDLGEGDKVKAVNVEDERGEADYIANAIMENHAKGASLSSHAVLYRMNAQSSIIETSLKRKGIAYRIVGGLSFYDRAEIKDALSYMELVVNSRDNLRLKRVINTPARKIGDTTIDRVEEISSGLGITMMEVIAHAKDFPTIARAAGALEGFYELYQKLTEMYSSMNPGDFTDELLNVTGLRGMLTAMGEEGETKLQNVNELVSSVRRFEDEYPEGDISDFLQDIALVTSMDENYDDNDKVTLMTLHSAKGLEFEYVYIAGMEEGVFPSERSRYSDEDIEEERRLAYVGMTRAKKELTLIYTDLRMLYGATRRNRPSRFIEEAGEQGIERVGNRKSYGGASFEGYHSAGGYKNTVPAGQKPVQRAAGVGTVSAPKPAGSGVVRVGYSAGDRIKHKMFGEGTVINVTPIGGDMLVEIEFDKVGKKKAMANYAPMEKI